MQSKVNNRYREYTIAVPAHLADEIRRQAKLNGVSDNKFLADVVIKVFAEPIAEAQPVPA